MGGMVDETCSYVNLKLSNCLSSHFVCAFVGNALRLK